MACKHLKRIIVEGEPGIGEVEPTLREKFVCGLGRRPRSIGWVGECADTPEEGPCWWWKSQYRDELDPEF